MTAIRSNATFIRLVDTPLNNYNEDDYLQITHSDLVPYQQAPPHDAIQQRMFLILGFAILCVIMFSIFVLPQWISGQQLNLSSNSSDSLGGAPPVAMPVDSVVGNGRISAVFSPEVQHWGDEIVRWSAVHGVDPNAVATIMQIESCGDPQAISSAGAQGLFQVMPFHFTDGEIMLDPETNARRGVAYFAEQLGRFGEVGLAFAAYNGGPGNAVKIPSAWPNETQRYHYWGTGIYSDVQAGLTSSPRLQEWFDAGGLSLCRQASTRLGL